MADRTGGRALIVCVSVSHGNTAAVARAMATVLGADIREPEEVDPETLGKYDVVGFGSGIFFMSHHPRLRHYVQRLPEARGTRAFVFTTCGTGDAQHLPWQRPLESILRGKGYDVVGSFACRGFDTWLPLKLMGGLNRGHPDAIDLTRTHDFAHAIKGAIPGDTAARGLSGGRAR